VETAKCRLRYFSAISPLPRFIAIPSPTHASFLVDRPANRFNRRPNFLPSLPRDEAAPPPGGSEYRGLSFSPHYFSFLLWCISHCWLRRGGLSGLHPSQDHGEWVGCGEPAGTFYNAGYTDFHAIVTAVEGGLIWDTYASLAQDQCKYTTRPDIFDQTPGNLPLARGIAYNSTLWSESIPHGHDRRPEFIQHESCVVALPMLRQGGLSNYYQTWAARRRRSNAAPASANSDKAAGSGTG
jgi:hypothetical protein